MVDVNAAPSPSSSAPAVVPERPAAQSIVELVQKDLDESRSLLQRLLTIEDALTGTTVTLVAALLGLAFANKRAAIAWLLVSIVVIMAYLAARVAVQWRRVTTRIGALEQIVNAYASVLRESGPARPKALERLDRRLARYSFGAQGTLDRVSFNDLRRANKKRLRWWLLPVNRRRRDRVRRDPDH